MGQACATDGLRTPGTSGYVEFCDPQAADNARAIYNGWQGWDAKGLLIETCAPADKRVPLKRDREPGVAHRTVSDQARS